MGLFNFLFGSRSADEPLVGMEAAQNCFARGNEKAERGDLFGAIADFSKAIALQPSFAVAWQNRGSNGDDVMVALFKSHNVVGIFHGELRSDGKIA